jgi:tRNA pseudouridine38-40 synthase
MRKVKLVLEYDGTDYVGWQIQANGRSVQATLQGALAKLLGHEVRVTSATRTDSGVHAEGQVACFDTERDLPLKAYWKGLGSILPPDLAVVDAAYVDPEFDPRRSCKGKTYRYLISNRRAYSALRRRTHWQIFQELDIEKMRRAATALVGRHDFSAFRAADCQASHAVRELKRVDVEGEDRDEIAIYVEGTAFLKHMVRNIVGTLAEVGRGRESSEWVASILESRDRTRGGPTAPAHGLTLVEVSYGDGRRPATRGAQERSLSPDPVSDRFEDEDE